MTGRLLRTVLDQAAALAVADGTPDGELLGRFARTKDEQAFAALVRRHGPLVWNVCRQMLPADADAEDAFQATFLALVRGAKSVRQADRLGGWLHGVAYRVCLKARRAAAARRKREQAAAAGEAAPGAVPDTAWEGLLAAVHEEVQNLPDGERAAFVLCGLEGVTPAAAAERLGWKPGTLTGRLCRARQRLLDRLARRGVTAGVLGVGAATASAAVPMAIVSRATCVLGPPATVPAAVIELSTGVIGMSTRSKWLAAAVLAVGGMTATVGGGLLAQRPADDQAAGQPPGERGTRERGDRGGQPPERGDRGSRNPFNNTREARPAEPPAEPGRGGGAAGGFPGGMGGMGGGFGPAPRAGWEYKIVALTLYSPKAEDELNKFGADGWELVAVQGPTEGGFGGSQARLAFKRPKPAAGVVAGGFGGMGGGVGGGSGGGGGFGGAMGQAMGTGGPAGGVMRATPEMAGALADSMMRTLDKDGDGKVSKDEAGTRVREFDAADANKDGFLDKDELRKYAEARAAGGPGGLGGRGGSGANPLGMLGGGSMSGTGTAPPGPLMDLMASQMFSQSDANKDGKLSKSEAGGGKPVADAFDRFDANKNGSLDAAEFRKFQEWRMNTSDGTKTDASSGGTASTTTTGDAGPAADAGTSTEVYKLKYARAADLAATLGTLAQGRNNPFGGNMQVKIAADERTNALIVIADAATQKAIRTLVEKLDTPAEPKR